MFHFICPTETLDLRELKVICNNGFSRIFNCCWRDSVKPLQFFCYSLLMSYLIDERQLMFFSKLQHTDNPILCTLIYLPIVKYEILGLLGSQVWIEWCAESVWLCF